MQHSALPITPQQMAAAAAESISAGANAVHLHVRSPDGSESLYPADVARTLDVVRSAAPGTPLGVSTGAWILPDPAARLRCVGEWTLLPDFASVNFHEDDAAALASLLLQKGVAVEMGLANPLAAERFAASGVASRCLGLLLEPQEQEITAASRTLRAIETVLDRAGITLTRLLHGTDVTAWPLLDEAVARHYAARIGLEDTLTLPDGTRAPDNRCLVAEARRRIVSGK